MTKFILGCVSIGFALALLVLLIGCSGIQVKYPEPVKTDRPQIFFVDSTDDDGKTWLCLTVEDTRNLMKYIVTLEKDLDKAIVTIQEINKAK